MTAYRALVGISVAFSSRVSSSRVRGFGKQIEAVRVVWSRFMRHVPFMLRVWDYSRFTVEGHGISVFGCSVLNGYAQDLDARRFGFRNQGYRACIRHP